MSSFPNYDPRYVDQLVLLAEQNLANGVIEEPRGYYGIVTLRSAQPLATQFPPNTFINGDQFPVRLTQMVLAVRPTPTEQGVFSFDDERLVQHVGLRMRWHDTFYMNNAFMPAPVWANKPVSGADAVQRGASSWIFDRPAILTARDGIRVQMQLEQAPASPRPCSVAFTGVGLLSKRPYFIASSLLVSDGNVQNFDAADLHNDGGEPIALTDATFMIGAETSANDAAGDIRRGRFQVKILGNGTQSDWFATSSPGTQFCPGQLLGLSTGRSIVHRFPGDGIVLQPGDGVTLEAQALASDVQGAQFTVGMFGYMMLT